LKSRRRIEELKTPSDLKRPNLNHKRNKLANSPSVREMSGSDGQRVRKLDPLLKEGEN
jgi:hypothetical protein